MSGRECGYDSRKFWTFCCTVQTKLKTAPIHVHWAKDCIPIKWPGRTLTAARLSCAGKCTECQDIVQCIVLITFGLFISLMYIILNTITFMIKERSLYECIILLFSRQLTLPPPYGSSDPAASHITQTQICGLLNGLPNIVFVSEYILQIHKFAKCKYLEDKWANASWLCHFNWFNIYWRDYVKTRQMTLVRIITQKMTSALTENMDGKVMQGILLHSYTHPGASLYICIYIYMYTHTHKHKHKPTSRGDITVRQAWLRAVWWCYITQLAKHGKAFSSGITSTLKNTVCVYGKREEKC